MEEENMEEGNMEEKNMEEENMEEKNIKTSVHFIKNTSLNKLSKRSGVKTLSTDAYPIIHDILTNKMIEVTDFIKSVNAEHGTRNIMLRDAEKALKILGVNMTFK